MTGGKPSAGVRAELRYHAGIILTPGEGGYSDAVVVAEGLVDALDALDAAEARVAAVEAERDEARAVAERARMDRAAYGQRALAAEAEAKRNHEWWTAETNRSHVAEAEVARLTRERDALDRANAVLIEARDHAQAEVGNLSADYDRRGERLWRLAAKAGHVPTDSDNDASAELTVSSRLDELAVLALADEWERLHIRPFSPAADVRAALGGTE